MVCVQVEVVSLLAHRIHCSDSLLLERRPWFHCDKFWRRRKSAVRGVL